MSDHDIDYPPADPPPYISWVADSADSAAGYAKDALGEWVLYGLVIYGPTTDKVRGVRLRDYRKAANRYGTVVSSGRGEPPPSLDAIREHWRQRTAMDIAMARNAETGFNSGEFLDILGGELDCALRRPEEAAEDFYTRIARTHAALAAITDKPSAKLAELAGVPVGTAASWVSRAKAKGLYPQEGEQV